jgi:hypothetical protein
VIADGRVGIGGESVAGQLGDRVRVVGEQHLAQRGGMSGQQGAHVERLEAVVGSEHVVDDEDLAFVQRADPHRLVGPCRQRV